MQYLLREAAKGFFLVARPQKGEEDKGLATSKNFLKLKKRKKFVATKLDGGGGKALKAMATKKK